MYLVDDTGIDITSGNAELYQLNTDKCGTLKVQGDVLGGGVASGELSEVSFHTFLKMDHIAANSTYLAVYTSTTVHYYNKSAVETLLTNTESLIQKMTIDETHVFFKKSDTEIKKQAIGLPASSTTITLSESADGNIFKIIDTHIVLAGTTVAKFYDKASGVLQKTYTSASLIVSMCSNDTHYFFCRRTSLNNVTIDKVLKTSMAIVASFPVSSSSIASSASQSDMGAVIKDNIVFMSNATTCDNNKYAIVSLDTTNGLYSEQLLNTGALYYHGGLWIWDYELWIGRYDRYATKNTIEQRSVSLTLTAYNREVYITKQIEVTDGVLSDSLSIPETMRGLFTFYIGNQSDFDVTINNLKVHYNRVPVLLDIDNRRPVAGDYIYIKCINSSSVDSIFFGVTEATEYSIVMSTPDTEIIGVRVPSATPGRCSVYLQSIDGDSNAIDIVMQASHASAMSDRCTQYTELAYTQSITDLYPSGQSIAKYEGSNFWKLNRVIAHMAKLIEGQVCSILQNSSPITADVSIPEWTEEYSSDCMTPSQIALFRPGSNEGVFYDMAARLGLDIDIKQTTVTLASCIGKCTQSVWSQSVLYTWIIYIYGLSPIRANCIGKCTQKLSYYDSKEIECIFNKYKPAHTQLSIIYVSEGLVIDENGDGIIDENGNNIAYFA